MSEREINRKWDRIDDQGEGIVLADIERYCEHIDAIGEAAHRSGAVRPETCGLIDGVVGAARQFLTAQAQRRYLARESQQRREAANSDIISRNEARDD